MVRSMCTGAPACLPTNVYVCVMCIQFGMCEIKKKSGERDTSSEQAAEVSDKWLFASSNYHSLVGTASYLVRLYMYVLHSNLGSRKRKEQAHTTTFLGTWKKKI